MFARSAILFVVIALQLLSGDAQRRRTRPKVDAPHNQTTSDYDRKPDDTGETEEDPYDLASILNRINEKLASMSSINDQQLRKLENLDYRLTKLEIQLHEKTETLRTDVKDISREVRQIDWAHAATSSAMNTVKNDVASIKEHFKTILADKEGTGSSDDNAALTTKVQIVSRNMITVLNNLIDLKSDMTAIKRDTNTIANSTSLFNYVLTEMLTGKQFQTSMSDVHRTAQPMYAVALPVSPNALLNLPQDCSQVTGNKSGVYSVQPAHSPTPFFVYCDLQTRGGGWTVIQNRYDGSVDFFKGWSDYRHGFGNVAGESWLGLDKIHLLTNYKLNELLIELEDFKSENAYAHYDVFSIGSEIDGYSINALGGYKGTAGDSLSYHAGQKFSTQDRDHDSWIEGNCAQSHLGAWWYNSCEKSNLNGRYLKADVGSKLMYVGMYWNDWKGPTYSLKSSRIMIRPQRNNENPQARDALGIANPLL